jgi:DNA-binding beta-propeller fold protein YncE
VALAGCGVQGAPGRYLVITHSALDRVSFFDLDRRAVVGVLPTQKLPHDMLLGSDGRTLYVVNSGGQCISTYDLGSGALWRAARAFMVRDTARSARSSRVRVPGVSALPAGIEHHHLTEPTFPERARVVHARVRATTHQACTDCHDRSVGGKPFAPVFIDGGRAIRLVHLGTRDITELDAATLEVRRRIALPIPPEYSPVEAWVQPGSGTAFVTCRDSIGRGLPGIIAIIDLASGACVKRLVPGIYPWHMVPNADGSRLYVNDFQSSRISVVDVGRQLVVDSLVVENGPAAILPIDGGRSLLVSCFYTNRALVVDLATHAVRRRMAVGSNPTMLLPAGDGARVWVLCGGESELQLLDLRSGRVVEHHALPFGAYAMKLVPGNAKAS